MVIGPAGTRSSDQLARAHAHNSARPPQSGGGAWPRRLKASRSSAAAAAAEIAGASVCLDSFSPAALTSTGRWQ